MALAGTVILVPGIGGNNLYTPPTFFGLAPRSRIWLNPATMGAGGWRLLGLGPDGISPDVPFAGSLIPGPPLANYYDALAKQLEALGWVVLGAEVDWRLSLSRNVDALVRQVGRQQGRGSVHLLAHSRGGLLCRAAMPALASAGYLDRLGWCAGLGVPHYGSWEAAGLLAGWNSTANFLALVLEHSAAILSLGFVLGPLRHVITSWPGAYELLPNPLAPGVSPAEINAIYDPAEWEASGVPVSPTWLAAARTGWASLPLIPQSVDWFDVVGRGVMTPVSLRLGQSLEASTSWNWTQSGDGAVRTDWAVQPGRRKISTPTSHGAMTYDLRVIQRVSEALRDGLRSDEVIEGPVLQ